MSAGTSLTPCNRLEERMPGWFEMMHQLVAYNYQDCEATWHQYGGTTIFSVNNVACRVTGSRCDTTGLGWWTSTCFWGWNGIITRIVCVYWPCTPTGTTDKIFSVHAQHQQFFDEQCDDICPWEAFIWNLWCADLDLWLDQGKQLIVALYANKDLQDVSVATASGS